MLELLEVMTEAFPSPAEHPLPSVTTPDGKPVTGLSSDPKGPLLAEVVKTTSDSYVGRISLVRVFSGTLRPDASVHVSGHGMAERLAPAGDAGIGVDAHEQDVEAGGRTPRDGHGAAADIVGDLDQNGFDGRDLHGVRVLRYVSPALPRSGDAGSSKRRPGAWRQG